jgi:hypothetical protein
MTGITATTTLKLLCISTINDVESTKCVCFMYYICVVQCERLVDNIPGVSIAIGGFMIEIGTSNSGP